jgi:hypothetical protein
MPDAKMHNLMFTHKRPKMNALYEFLGTGGIESAVKCNERIA